jgi:transposase
MVVTGKDIREKLKDIDEFLLEEYKKNHPEEKRDWRTYEEQFALRIKEAMQQLKPLVNEAVDTITICKGPGAPHALTLKQRVLLLLLQRLFGESNRMMASMLAIFSVLSDIEVSYKTIERLYSDEEVEMVLHNLHILILKKKGVKDIDAAGDGTGYSLTISKHYATETQKLGEEIKEARTQQDTTKERKKKQAFVYSFKLIDVKTKMYVAHGTSMKSEKQAYENATKMKNEIEMRINSIRLDRYYSCHSYVDAFDKTTSVYVIPKKNATLRGEWKWKRTMFDFVQNTPNYLEQYYLREMSENGWSVDKRRFGWGIAQRRDDRINTADFCTTIWHNLFEFGNC